MIAVFNGSIRPTGPVEDLRAKVRNHLPATLALIELVVEFDVELARQYADSVTGHAIVLFIFRMFGYTRRRHPLSAHRDR